MFCAFRALPHLIPEIILAAKRKSEVFIVSPWIQDVTLKIPIIYAGENSFTTGEMPLSSLLSLTAIHLDLHFILIVRDKDRHLLNTIRHIQSESPQSIEIYQEPFLHAKLVVTNTVVLQMSANIIPTSLYRNIETCAISKNTYNMARRYVVSELKVSL